MGQLEARTAGRARLVEDPASEVDQVEVERARRVRPPSLAPERPFDGEQAGEQGRRLEVRAQARGEVQERRIGGVRPSLRAPPTRAGLERAELLEVD